MYTIGIRASPRAVTFAIVDSERSMVVNVEAIMIPSALSVPEALKYVRNTVLDVLLEYDVELGCLRIAEPTAQSQNLERVYIEGVIQEAFASSRLTRYLVGHIAGISARIGMDRADFKRYVDGEKDYAVVENWSALKKEEREAVLAGLGAMHA